MIDRDHLLRLLGEHEITPAAELRSKLGVSPATLSRLMAGTGERVHRLGRGRATRYALARQVAGLGSRLPVFRIDEGGRPTLAAELLLIGDSSTWVEPAGAGGGHLHAGLPPVLHDMAPAGYLGRRFPQRHSELGLPSHLTDWNDHHRLIAIARRGEDLPGDLVVGHESLDRFLASEPPEAAEEDFPALAEASGRGGAGSSAAGEQPKFTTCSRGRQVLVKFTPGDGSPSDLRWRDLLASEALALEVLQEHGVAASRARILDIGSRRFLEVERFDRLGGRGRRGVLTLAPLDDDLFGARDSWSAAAERLRRGGLLSAGDARTIRLVEAFGVLIANSDMHFGNVSFFGDGLRQQPALRLAPVYDMLPMSAAPRAGILPSLPCSLPRPTAALLDVWDEAASLARVFWERVAGEARVSAAFRTEAERLAVTA